LYNLGKYETAIDEFEQAYTLFQSDALLFNLAQAHRQLQHCERALYYYKRFLEGSPSPALAVQVSSLLPKLEAACRTTSERPVGAAPATDGAAGATSSSAGPLTASHEAAPVAVASAESDLEHAGDGSVPTNALGAARILVTGAMSAGMVVSGKSAPTAGVRLTVTTPPRWMRGADLGGSLGVGRLWRGDDLHNATLAQIAATVRYRAGFEWGRFTIAGELGAAHFSSLGYSNGVVPGVTTTALWVPLGRAEVGVEHDVARGLAVRVAAAVGGSPRTGPLLSAVGELDALIGLRYER
jgi:tetratricopeptide (TPR) repeat protein